MATTLMEVTTVSGTTEVADAQIAAVLPATGGNDDGFDCKIITGAGKELLVTEAYATVAAAVSADTIEVTSAAGTITVADAHIAYVKPLGGNATFESALVLKSGTTIDIAETPAEVDTLLNPEPEEPEE